MGGWSCGCTPPKECCRLPPTYFWTTWRQTRAFLISVNNFSGWFDNSIKGEVFGYCRWMGGWSRGSLHLKNAADYRLPTFGLHGTKLGPSWYQWIIKVFFLAGLTILNKERCLCRLCGWGVDPDVALHLRNAADYRLPTFKPHGTKLGHSWYQWIIKSDFSRWFDNSEKGEVSGQIEWMGSWSHGCTPPQECCRLPLT